MTRVAIEVPPSPPAPDAGRERVRVLVADGDGLARRMMREALHDAAGVIVVGAAREAHDTLELTRHYRPDVLLLDADLPPGGGEEVIPRALKASPLTRVVTISSREDESALDALRAGAVGHISKDLEPEVLAGLVRRAADGEAIVPRRLVMPLLSAVHAVPEAGWRPLRSRLTTREWEIVELLATGASTQHIADSLFLSATTVYSHIKSVLRKLGVHTRDEAVAAAERLREEEIAEQPFSLAVARP
ncbi:MAG TPA: response regulator transcription factor [Solirubrobacteraceae bacterium]|nr:response regulator transcription factor [Solirubrobacteraceae bacterium]